MKALGTHDHNAFLARQAAYTKRREKAYIEQNINNDLAYSQRLEELYRETAANIETEIMAQYMRYAAKEGLTMAEARKKVSKMDVEAFAKKAEEYVKNKDFSKDANEQLRAYNLKMRVSRLELMQRTMELEVLKLNGQEEGMLNERLKQSYLDELERQAGILGLDRTERQAVMKNADLIVNGDYQATPFSDRIWTNNRELAARLRVGLERSILRGEHPNKWAKSLQGLLKQEMGGTGKGNALYKARRLAITETARVQIESAKRSFEEAGFEKYIWIAEVDGRQCSVCGAMDDKVFSIKGSTIGANLPPLHPFCRCSVAAYEDDEDDFAAWLDSIDPDGAGEETGISSMASGAKNYYRDSSEDIYLDPEDIRKDEHAYREYDRIKNSNQEVEKKKIYNNINQFEMMLGFTQEDVNIAFDHVFNTIHELENGPSLFRPDYDMAQSWNRLINDGDKIQEHDLILLQHERLERDLMYNENMSYEDAHEKASKTYCYKVPKKKG